MRGEEVQVLGAVAAGLLPPDALVCHPGTHAKWIIVANGEIDAMRTMMTGEMFALLGQHSILAPQIAGAVIPGDAFAAGVDEGLAGASLLASLFQIRARAVLGLGDVDAASRASGLLIGCDVRAGLQLADTRHVTLIGRPDLSELYAAAIDRAGGTTARIDGTTAFLAGIRRLAAMQ
jgi:2-dehydro-3-deoxygalactonokinase